MTMRINENEILGPAERMIREQGGAQPDQSTIAALLNPESWEEVLETYARAMKLAVALTDREGRLLGTCHSPQPIWSLAQEARPAAGGCPFCLPLGLRCTAVADALRMAGVVLAHDQAGLAHVAAPLSLGGEPLGALLAGQVFDRHPESLALERVARELHIPKQQMWDLARRQIPVSRASLAVYGKLLSTLGQAFLRQRYSGILERKLDETDHRFQLLVAGVEDYALFTMDAAGRITSWNRGAERLFGYSEGEILGQEFSRIFTPEDVQNGVPEQELEKAAREGQAESERWHLRKDGGLVLAAGVIGAMGHGERREFRKMMRDVTERRNAEQKMLQAQKLESLGVLAGGIAHDFNNLLTGIMGNASLLLRSESQAEEDRELLADIVQASERAAELTNQMLAYAGKSQFLVTRFDLCKLVAEMLHLLEASIPKMAHLELTLAPDLPRIEADASQIQQVVMNLAINAAEAIGPQGGTVRISTGLTGGEVYLEVSDTGCGMDEETRAKMFDPFFTTKFQGRGLGLAAVSGIVRGHRGRMQVESGPGVGTTFRVFFPALEGSLPEEEKVSSPAAVRGTGLILIVDDDATVARTAKAMLEGLGYAALIAKNGLAAVTLFEQKSAEIAAVLLDMSMPVMSGEEALRRIKAIRPDVRVIVSSGYSETLVRERLDDTQVAGFIQKPYTVESLAEKIKAASA